MSEEDSNFEVMDVENYRPQKEQQFSHQVLVMKAMSKCVEAGNREMRQGYYNEKLDKLGNRIMVYVPDTRKEFIESVNTLKMIMARDFDDEIVGKIKELNKKLDGELQKLILYEKGDWDNATINIKRMRWTNNIFYYKGCLNHSLPYYQEYIEYEIKHCRELFAEISRLVKRLNDYGEVSYSNIPI